MNNTVDQAAQKVTGDDWPAVRDDALRRYKEDSTSGCSYGNHLNIALRAWQGSNTASFDYSTKEGADLSGDTICNTCCRVFDCAGEGTGCPSCGHTDLAENDGSEGYSDGVIDFGV